MQIINIGDLLNGHAPLGLGSTVFVAATPVGTKTTLAWTATTKHTTKNWARRAVLAIWDVSKTSMKRNSQSL